MSGVTTTEIAERLDMPLPHVCSWAVAWYGPMGQGKPHRLDLVDLYVARAWQVIGGSWANRDYGYANRRQRIAETAIRADPARWLLLSDVGAATFDEAEDATSAWLTWPSTAATLIDLWSTP